MINREERRATGPVVDEHPPRGARRAGPVIAASQDAPQSESHQLGGLEGQCVRGGGRRRRRRVVVEGGEPDPGAVVVAQETRLVALADADRPALAEGDPQRAFYRARRAGWL